MQTVQCKRNIIQKLPHSPGFTLIELSVVLIIIAMITGMGLVAGQGAIEGARRAQTENKLDEIEKALMRFRALYERLPCPSDPSLISSNANYGKEDGDDTACNSSTSNSATGGPPFLFTDSNNLQIVEGGVPTKALGLPDEYMNDGWGRKFAYAVDPLVTRKNAFVFIPPATTNCSITVTNGTAVAAGVRSSGAVYTLLSYGENGHGSYLNGSRVNTGSTNSYEQQNCHCDSSAAYSAPSQMKYVQRILTGATTTTGGFDDIVRYKERWQMQTDNDYKKNANYREYQLFIRYAGGSLNVYYYRYGCNGWTATSTPRLAPTGATDGIQIALSRDNSMLFAYLDDPDAAEDCQPYNIGITGGTVSMATCSPLTLCVPTDACPAYQAGNKVALSDNGYLAITYGSSPYIKFSKVSETDTTTPYFAPLVSALLDYSGHLGTCSTCYNQIPSAKPSIIAFSKNADYFFATDKSTYGYMYNRVSEKFFKVSTQPTGGTPSSATCSNVVDCSSVGSAAFSQNGKYFAVGYVAAGPTPAVAIWRIKNGTPLVPSSSTGYIDPFTLLAGTGALGFAGTAAPTIAFSPDGKYFAVVGGQNAAADITNVKIYSINEDDTFTAITIDTAVDYAQVATPSTTVNPVFSTDSNHLLFPITYNPLGTPTYGLAQFKRIAVDKYEYVLDSESVDSPFYSAAFSIDNMVYQH